MDNLVFATQVVSTLAMVGVIWFVQVVHYPLFAMVGENQFVAYETAHQRLTTIVVGPLMIIELTTAVICFGFRPETIPMTAAVTGLALIVVVWLSTFFVQVPAHARLNDGFDARAHKLLVRSNWLRTVAWSMRGLLVLWMYSRVAIA